jgi:enamine deaminase RidA (YjgF/YER057c/UK114 family)
VGKTEDRLRTLNLQLPPLRAPIGKYVGAVRSDNLLFLSGHGPIEKGQRTFIGKLGREFSVEQGRAAARLVIVNALRTVQEELGTLDNVARVVKVLGFVNSAPGFHEQPAVIDGASELLLDVFEERGRHARSAVGMSELPFNIAVEIEMILEVREI